MIVKHQLDITDAFTTRLIRRTARQFAADEQQREDLIQDLTLALLESMDTFDPERATWPTFVKNVIHRAAISLTRHRNAKRRRPKRAIRSLNTVVADEDGQAVELGSTISEADYYSAKGITNSEDTVLAEREWDLDSALASLPEPLRDLAERLKYQSLGEISEETGMARSTLSHQIGKLRAHLKAADLDALV